MTFEATLASIDASLKALVVMAQTGASAVHTFGAAAEAVAQAAAQPTKASRKAKETAPTETTAAATGNTLGLVDGDPEGTRYWVIEKHNTVYAQKPGDTDCTIEGAKIESAAYYLEKKAEYAKKSLVQPAQTATPAAESKPAATASTASSSAETVSFKDLTDKLILLSKDERPGKGRDAITALLAKHLPNVAFADRRVPKLADLNKNVELMAEVMALLAPDAPAAAADDIFG